MAQLIAYVIPADPTDVPSVAELRRWLRLREPEYMIPSWFVPIDSFPLTPTRKIDRKALPRPELVIEPDETAVEPRDDIEATLAGIWASVLGRPSVGVNQNFFDLGGHSLLATRVFALIEQETGRRIPLSALFETPTIAELAGAIRGEVRHSDWSSLVPIQQAGTKPPFFYVAPYLISVLQFANLGEELAPDQPLYGFQPQGLDGLRPPHNRIEDMAAHYITELKSIQPTGPYSIGGHCSGAWVAFEMARQLEASGDELHAVVLVDQGPPAADRPAVHPAKYIWNRVRFYFRDGRFRHALAWKLKIATARHLVRRVGPPTARYVEEVRAAHREAFGVYGSAKIKHDIFMVRSAESLALSDKDWFLQWADRTEGALRIEDVPGTHANLLVRPYVEAMAVELRKALDRTDACRR
jgi:thioesterase domain-containing protein